MKCVSFIAVISSSSPSRCIASLPGAEKHERKKGLLFRVNKTPLSICLQSSNSIYSSSKVISLSGRFVPKTNNLGVFLQSRNLVVWRLDFHPRAVRAAGQVFIGGNKTPGAAGGAWQRAADGGESSAELADIYLAFAASPDDSRRAQEREGAERPPCRMHS